MPRLVRWIVGAASLRVAACISIVALEEDSDGTEIPTTIPSNCSGDAPASLPNQWNAGACQTGLNANKWDFNTEGTQLPADPNRCINPMSISCGRRSAGAWSNPHLVFAPQGTPSGMMVVYLPGTGRHPAETTRLLRSASRAGHRVLGLSYMSYPFTSAQADRWCVPTPPSGNGTAADCNSDLHEQVLFGDANPDFKGKSENVWAVPQKDSVEALVQDVLANQAWGREFLKGSEYAHDGGLVDWQKIIISGHSQGASHAGYLTQVRQLHAVLFSGPQDSQASAENWGNLSVPSRTRRSFHHLHEECGDEPLSPATYCEAGSMPRLLQDMGFGGTTLWAGGDLPRSLTNVVTNVAPNCTGGRFYHNGIVTDDCAPDEFDVIFEALFTGISTPTPAPTPATTPPDSHGVAARMCVLVFALALALL